MVAPALAPAIAGAIGNVLGNSSSSSGRSNSQSYSGMPEWMKPYYQDMAGRANDLSQQPWPTMPGADQTTAQAPQWWQTGQDMGQMAMQPLIDGSSLMHNMYLSNLNTQAPGANRVNPTVAPGGSDAVLQYGADRLQDGPGGGVLPGNFQAGNKFNSGNFLNSNSPNLGQLNFNKDFNTYGLESHINPSAKGNPYLNSVIQNVESDINRNLNENVLTGIGRDAQSAGQYGSSRHGIADGIARRGAAEEAAQQAASLRFQDYTNSQNRALQAGGALGNLDLGAQGQASTRANITGNYGIAGENLRMDADNSRFGNALAGWNANEGQRRFDNPFLEGQRRYDTDTSFDQAQAGWDNDYRAFNSLFGAANSMDTQNFGQNLAAGNQFFDQTMQGNQFNQDVLDRNASGIAGAANNFLNYIPQLQGLGDQNYLHEQGYLDRQQQSDMYNQMGPYNQMEFLAQMFQGIPTESTSSSQSRNKSKSGLLSFL